MSRNQTQLAKANRQLAKAGWIDEGDGTYIHGPKPFNSELSEQILYKVSKTTGDVELYKVNRLTSERLFLASINATTGKITSNKENFSTFYNNDKEAHKLLIDTARAEINKNIPYIIEPETAVVLEGTSTSPFRSGLQAFNLNEQEEPPQNQSDVFDVVDVIDLSQVQTDVGNVANENNGKVKKPNPEDLFTIPDLTTRYGDQFFFQVDPNTGTQVLYLQKDPTKPINQGAGANDKPIKIGFINPEIFEGQTTLPRSASGVVGPLGLRAPFVYNNPDFFRTQTPVLGGSRQRELREKSLDLINNPNIIGGSDDGSDPDIFAGDVFKGPNQSKAFTASFDSTLNPAAERDPNSLNKSRYPFIQNEAILAAQRDCEASNADPLVGCRGSAELLTQVGVTQGFFTPELQRILNVTPTGEPTGRPTFGDPGPGGFGIGGRPVIGDIGQSPNSQNERLAALSRSAKGTFSGFIQYPEKMNGDRMIFQVKDYQASGLGDNAGYGLGQATRRPAPTVATIFLPLQRGYGDTLACNWGEGELNPLTAMAASAAYTAIATSGEQGLVRGMGAGANALMTGAQTIMGASGNEELKQLVAAYFTQKAVGMQGFLSRTAGAAINNNLELLFQGPTLRSFNFQFTLTPRNQRETLTIRRIIKTFKINMVPEASPSNLFLLAPRIFDIAYLKQEGNGTRLHPYMNRFKRCALKDFSVNYSPDGQYMTYKDGGMTSYQLSMTFAELDPVLANDYDGVNSGDSEGMGY